MQACPLQSCSFFCAIPCSRFVVRLLLLQRGAYGINLSITITNTSMSVSSHDTRSLGGLFLVLSLAASLLLGHILTGGQYRFHRDELATLDDARHLAWGYVDYPPITPFFARVSLTLFGTSLVGFRFFAAIAQALAVVLTGLMARELGGGRGAQLV